MSNAAHVNNKRPPAMAPELRRRLAALVSREGEQGAAKALGVPSATLARAVAGFGIRQATAELIRSRLAALETEPGKGGAPAPAPVTPATGLDLGSWSDDETGDNEREPDAGVVRLEDGRA